MQYLSSFLVMFFTIVCGINYSTLNAGTNQWSLNHSIIFPTILGETPATTTNPTQPTTPNSTTTTTQTTTTPTTTTPPKAPDPIKLPSSGIILLAGTYGPKLPEKLPEGTKPSQFLKTLDVNTAQFEPSGDPTIIFIGPDWKNKLNDAKNFQKGQKLAIPVTLDISAEQGKKTTQCKGAILMEVQGIYSSMDELNKVFPEVQGKTRKIFLINNAEGTFKTEEIQQDSTLIYNGGPIELDWSTARKQENINFYSCVFEFFGCFVTTAVYQTWNAPELNIFRTFRDKVIKTSPAGARLLWQYYRLGPSWAAAIKNEPMITIPLRTVFSGLALILDHIDLEHPIVQGMGHKILEYTDLVLTPWLESQEGKAGQALP